MECLRNYINVRGCGATAPPSGIYLNDLEGITLKQITSLADAQQQGFVGVYADIQTRALMRLADDFRAVMAERYKLKRILDTVSLPKSRADLSQTPPAIDPAHYGGFMVELDYNLNNEDQQFVNSPLSAIYIQELYLYIDPSAAGDEVSIIVRDLDTDTTVSSTTHIATAGWNNIQINQTFTGNYWDKSRKLFIGYAITTDNGVLSPAYYTVPTLRNVGYYGCLRIRGGSLSDTFLYTESDQTYGMAGILSLRCDFGSLICTNKDLFKRPLLYALGVEAMNEQLYTDRMNEYTLLRRNQAQENRERWSVDYDKSLKQVAQGISLDCDSCLECGGTKSPYITTTLP